MGMASGEWGNVGPTCTLPGMGMKIIYLPWNIEYGNYAPGKSPGE
jgi:hypothetical protein